MERGIVGFNRPYMYVCVCRWGGRGDNGSLSALLQSLFSSSV